MRRSLLALLAGITLLAGLVAAPVQAIVNGDNAATNPGAVSLWTDNPNRNRCSAALVDDEQGGPGTRWALTSAHCIYVFIDPAAGRTTARIGSTDNTTGYIPIKVVPGQFWYHPGFSPTDNRYDVMLVRLELETPPALSDGTPIQVMKWRGSPLPVGAIGQAYGWGWVCDGPPGLACSTWYAGPLQRMIAERRPDSECSELLHPATQICFAEPSGGDAMACLGDSGGPIKTPDFNGKPIIRWSIATDGDANPNCTQGVNGAPARGMAIDIGRPDIQQWMGDTMATSATSRRTAPPPPPATPKALAAIN